jgi:hypothetical protein
MPFEILGVEIDIVSFLKDHLWVLLIIPVLLFVGISFGWKKLVEMYQVQGKPLRSISVILKEAKSLVFTEDIYCVITRKGENIESLLWFTWIFFWRLMAATALMLITLFSLKIFGILPILDTSVLGWFSLIFLFVNLYGIGHLRKVFSHRFSTLEKMFNVASSEMRYDGGTNAKIYIYQYIIVSGWKQVYYPEETQIMYSVNKFKATEAGRQAAFQAAFDSAVTDKNSWTYEWDTSNSRVICSPIPFLPKNVSYPFPDKHPWNEFPLGQTFGEEVVLWNVAQYPHMLIAGTTGSGKSVTQRTLLLHALQSPGWRVLLIDPKRVELSQYSGHPNVLKIATEIDEAYALIQQLEQEMMSRYAKMKDAQVNHFESLPTVPPAILLMVDEVFALLELTAGSGKNDPIIKEQNEMKAAMTLLVGKIARLGRAAGVHMILATQRPDAKVLPGEVKANLDARVAQGRMDKIPSDMTLNSQAATKLPPIKGRALFRSGDEMIEFQAYFLAPENLPEFLELSTMIVHGEGDFLFEDKDAIEAGEPIATKKSKFKIPEIKFNFGAKINSWVDKKQSAMEANEARAGRNMEPKPKISRHDIDNVVEEKYIPAAQRDAKYIDEAFNEVSEKNLEGGFNESEFTNLQSPKDIKNADSLFVPAEEEADEFDFEYSEEEKNAGGYLDYPEYEDDLDFIDEEDLVAEDDGNNSATVSDPAQIQEKTKAESPVPNKIIPSPNQFEDLDESLGSNLESSIPLSPPVLDAPEKLVESSANSVEPENYDKAVLTVADVLRLASERGVPIPASELLAALKAEASQQNNVIPKPVSNIEGGARRPVQEESPEVPSPSRVIEDAPVRKPIKPNTNPPGGKIPAPPKAYSDSKDLLDSEDFGNEIDSTDNAPSILPPWMSESSVEYNATSEFSPPAAPKANPDIPSESKPSKIDGIKRSAEDFLRPTKEEDTEAKGPKRPKLF